MSRQQTQKTHEEHITEIWKMFKESQQKFDKTFEKSKQEADRQTRELKQQIKESRLETERQMKETDRRLNKYIGDSENRWGALGENLMEGNLVKKLREKGIEVEKVLTCLNVGDKAEFDIIAVNGKEVVVVEVKSTLKISYIKQFLKNLEKFKTWCPEYKDKTVYGAIAFLIREVKGAAERAEEEGLFVVKATGDCLIKNKKNFKPKSFQ